MTSALLVAAAFGIGSMPFGYWLVQLLRGRDLRRSGSGNPGATNALRVAGRGPAALVLALDVGKGALPVGAAVHLEAGSGTIAAVAVAAVGGHVLSPWLRFRGGKGVATALGALAVLHPVAAAGGLAVFVALVGWTRYVSLASVGSAAATALVAAAGAAGVLPAGRAAFPGAVAVLVIASIVAVRHVENIGRLASGRESRIGEEAR